MGVASAAHDRPCDSTGKRAGIAVAVDEGEAGSDVTCPGLDALVPDARGEAFAVPNLLLHREIRFLR